MFEQPIGKWSQQDVIHTPGSEGSVAKESGSESLPSPAHDQIQPVLGTVTNENAWPCGDNPSMSFDVSLPDQGDLRVKGSKGADPYPQMPGAK
jgi:hypothetical protein